MNTTTQMIQKGEISGTEGPVDANGNDTRASVASKTAQGVVSPRLSIPWRLRGEMGNLTPGTEVVYAQFEDGTGIILDRLDGEWTPHIPGDVTMADGDVILEEGDLQTKKAASYNEHTHRYESPEGEASTGGPE